MPCDGCRLAVATVANAFACFFACLCRFFPLKLDGGSGVCLNQPTPADRLLRMLVTRLAGGALEKKGKIESALGVSACPKIGFY